MAGESRAHWREKLDAAGIPNAPIQEIDEVFADPQTEALGFLQQTDDPAIKLGGLPLSFDQIRPALRAVVSPVGADTEAVFASLED